MRFLRLFNLKGKPISINLEQVQYFEEGQFSSGVKYTTFHFVGDKAMKSTELSLDEVYNAINQL